MTYVVDQIDRLLSAAADTLRAMPLANPGRADVDAAVAMLTTARFFFKEIQCDPTGQRTELFFSAVLLLQEHGVVCKATIS